MARADRTSWPSMGPLHVQLLHRAPAHALALFGTPGNFRLKRRGVGFEKRGNCRGFTRGCHGLPLGLRLGLAVFSLIAANCQFAKMRGARVITTVSGPEKAAHARLAGADEVINYRTENV